MKTKLTKEERELIPIIRDKWLNAFLSLPIQNQNEVRKLVDWIYELCGYAPPKIICLSSPFSCQIAVNILGKMGCAEIGNEIGNEIGKEIGYEIRREIKNGIRNEIMREIRNEIWKEIRNEIEYEIWNEIRNEIRYEIWNTNLKYTPFCWYMDTSDYLWISFYEYFMCIKAIKTHKKFEKYIKLLKNANIFSGMAFEKVYICSALPIEIHRNNNKKLHNIEGMAVKFKDGYGQYYLDGVYIPRKIFEQAFIDKTMLPQDVLHIDNVEIRGAVVRYMMGPELMEKLNAEIIDTYEEVSFVDRKPIHYRLFEFDLDDIKVRMLEVEDHTDHDKHYLGIPVQDDTTDCVGARAWTFNTSKDDIEKNLIGCS